MTFNEIIMYLLEKYGEEPWSEVQNNRKARRAWMNKMTTAWELIQENTAPDVYQEARCFFNMMDSCRYKAEEEE